MGSPSLLPPLVLSVALIANIACARAAERQRDVAQSPAGEDLITAEEIAATGARTAWDALRRTAPYLNMSERGSGEPAVMRRRGKSTIILNDAPIVMLDGVRLADFRNLSMIPANTIDHMVVIRGIDATTYYGTNAVGGVVLIKTKTD
ncbi:MAG: TonB-dependent receptor plug domain-containing protein [Gemmatimonadales bacterium]|nr:TonB-dependent receptor plug domain-containing protein [Gemmatimonadales bacterium]